MSIFSLRGSIDHEKSIVLGKLESQFVPGIDSGAIRSNHSSSMHLFPLHVSCPFKFLEKGVPVLMWTMAKHNIFILLVLQSCLNLLFSKWPLDLSIVC